MQPLLQGFVHIYIQICASQRITRILNWKFMEIIVPQNSTTFNSKCSYNFLHLSAAHLISIEKEHMYKSDCSVQDPETRLI